MRARPREAIPGAMGPAPLGRCTHAFRSRPAPDQAPAAAAARAL